MIMHIFNQAMSYYHCTKCFKDSVIRSNDKTLKVICCNGSEPVEYKLGKYEGTRTIDVQAQVVADEERQLPAPSTPELPKTRLDVPLSGTKPQPKKA